MITQQAQIIAYIDDFKLLMIVTLAGDPAAHRLQEAAGGGSEDHAIAME